MSLEYTWMLTCLGYCTVKATVLDLIKRLSVRQLLLHLLLNALLDISLDKRLLIQQRIVLGHLGHVRTHLWYLLAVILWGRLSCLIQM
jgi:hypothetical protein